MSQLIRSIGPSCALLGLVVWCCWPYLATSGSSLTGLQDNKLPRISRTTLDPEIRKPSERDPFQAKPEEEVEPADPQKSFAPLAAIGQLWGKLKEDRKWLADRLERAERAKALASAAPPAPEPPDPTQRIEHLRLKATYLHGHERLAMIDDRVYAEGDEVALPGCDEPPCTVQHVLSDRVILDVDGQTVNLAYPSALSSAKRHESPNALPIPASGPALPLKSVHLPPHVPAPPATS